MDPIKQRIAIAETCGWQVMGKPNPSLWWGNSPETLRDYTPDCNLGARVDAVPDYLNDLNAMHEAEKILTPQQWWQYIPALISDGCPNVAFSTSQVRAEAFLRTLNLWIES